MEKNRGYTPDPPENCHLNVKKMAKNFFLIDKNCLFFQKNCQSQIFLKKRKFLAIFLKKCQVFGNFLTVKWQFSGVSAP